jgi:Na+-transporting methylmalonyl-CoA/oxaloacetate decarboxylase beta subunit
VAAFASIKVRQQIGLMTRWAGIALVPKSARILGLIGSERPNQSDTGNFILSSASRTQKIRK